VEWNLIKSAGNYGWPYCAGPSIPYIDYDFDTATSGAAFDCDAPVNDSPYNTGLTQLPPARPATVWYGDKPDQPFPEFGEGCACPMAGPVYQYNPNLPSRTKFPAYYDDTPFFYEWGRKFVKEIKLDGGEVLEISNFLDGTDFKRPIDMTFGPDGAMYLLEWGSDFFGNTDSGLYRIDYLNNPPIPAGAGPRGEESSGKGGGGGGGGGGSKGNGGPELSCTAEPSTLASQGRKLKKVEVDVEVTDKGAGQVDVVLESVSSNRPDSGRGKSDKPEDIRGWKIGTLDTEGRLRAEGKRRYTIKYEATDKAGKSDACSPTVSVSRRG
jgi:hypothetical protein